MGTKVKAMVVGLLMVNLMACADFEDATDEHTDEQPDEQTDVDVVTRCGGVGDRKNSTLEVNGTVFVTEVPRQGTCDRNAVYTADFRSMIAGWRASVHFKNNGVWQRVVGGFNTAWVGYSYFHSGSSTEMHLCLDNGSTFYCGFGSNWVASSTYDHRFTGVSTGF